MSDDFKPDTIWRLQSQLNIQGLTKALKHADPAIRKRAAAALRTTNARDALPALREALAHEQDAEARLSIAAAIEALTDKTDTSEEEAIPAGAVDQNTPLGIYITRLQSKNPIEVAAAARELGELGDKIAVEPLMLLFKDASVSMQVRLAVAEALLKLESAPVEVTLLANLRSQDWEIRRKAAAILGQLKADWSVQPLAKALGDPHPVVRKTARAALKHIDTPAARQVLIRYQQYLNQQREAGNDDPTRPALPPTGLLPRRSRDAGNAKGGLLNRVRGEGEKAESAPLPGEKIHLDPTQPLDPKVIEEIDRLRNKAKPKDE